MSTLTLCQRTAGAPLSHLPTQACDRCRRNKTRCDRLAVCTTCSKSGAVCSYEAKPRRRGPRPRTMSARSRKSPSNPGSEAPGTTPPQAFDEGSPASVIPDPPGPPHATSCPFPGKTTPSGLDQALSGFTSRSSSVASPGSSSPSDGALAVSRVDSVVTDAASDEGCLMDHISLRATALGSVAHDPFVSPAITIPTFDGGLGGARTLAWTESCGAIDQLPRSVFLPCVELFLDRLYPIFPVLDRHAVLSALQDPPSEPQPIPPGMYCFLTALSAAVIVQLNVSEPLSDLDGQTLNPETMPLSCPANFFAHETLRVRREHNFIDCADEYTALSSFFLFAYYGNMESSRSAWYYLREAIGFALTMGLDDPETYLGLDAETHQRRLRLFWLLFVTERAYALQHRSTVILRPSIELPRVFDSGEPRLIYGFVMLVKVFATVDEDFVSCWRDGHGTGGRKHALELTTPFLTTELLSYNEDVPGALSMSEMDETQRLDILVTRQWLRVLVWRLRRRHAVGLLADRSPDSRVLFHQDEEHVHHPFQTSRSVLGIISVANRKSLEAHGIRMEQKVFNLATTLSETLQREATATTPAAFFSGQDLLHNFVAFLATFRNQPSRYLQPLLRDAAPVLGIGGMQMSPLFVSEEDKYGQQTTARSGIDEGTDYVG